MPPSSSTTWSLRSCQAFQEFNGPFIITNGGPRNSTTLISILVYNYAFKSNEMGMASALAWIMFVIVCILTIIAYQPEEVGLLLG